MRSRPHLFLPLLPPKCLQKDSRKVTPGHLKLTRKKLNHPRLLLSRQHLRPSKNQAPSQNLVRPPNRETGQERRERRPNPRCSHSSRVRFRDPLPQTSSSSREEGSGLSRASMRRGRGRQDKALSGTLRPRELKGLPACMCLKVIKTNKPLHFYANVISEKYIFLTTKIFFRLPRGSRTG